MMKTNTKKFSEEEEIRLNAAYSCGELADLWILTGIGGSKTSEEYWKYRAKVFEEMIKILSPKHKEYAEAHKNKE